jgi:hypothetical protein
MDLAGGHGERHSLQNLVALDRDVEIVDLQHGAGVRIRGHGPIVITLRT